MLKYLEFVALLLAMTMEQNEGFTPPASFRHSVFDITNAPQEHAVAVSAQLGGNCCHRLVGRNGRLIRPRPTRKRTTELQAGVPADPPSSPVDYFMGLFGGVKLSGGSSSMAAAEKLEAKLLLAIEGVQGRGRDVTQEQREAVDKAVEDLETDGGVLERASSPLVDGQWRLIFTTTPGTASPVQRSFVGVDNFAIYQDIDIFSKTAPPTVTNVVDFGPKVGQLRVTALASTAAMPMDGFVPRRGDGKFFGLNILGVSQTTPPKDASSRIDFQFDEANFDFKALPFKIPYPVPFRWLGDEVKGWIDVTYLSERLRIARGNKGTLFVLQRPDTASSSPAAAEEK